MIDRGDPAIVPPGPVTTSEAAGPGLTAMPEIVPAIPGLAVSVAVTDWSADASFRVTP